MKIIILITALFFIGSCGIKGPPLPPENEETIQKQKEPELAAPPVAQSSDATKATKTKKKRK